MRIPVHRSSTRRRLLTIAVLAAVLAVITVQTATGARPHTSSSGAAASTAVSSVGGVPANQPALDAAADDAEAIAGPAYYTDARVDDAANTVDLHLAGAPQSIIDQLQAKHPGTYVIDNGAAHPLSELLRVQQSLSFATLQSDGIHAVRAYPSPDGYLKVGVTDTTAVSAAQSALDAQAGAGLIKVYGGAEPLTLTGFRYNESSPWNGGDFIFHTGTSRFLQPPNNQWQENCSSGINVHKTGAPNTTYMLTAAHCFWMFTGPNGTPGVGTVVHNGYQTAGGTLCNGCSGTNIGQVAQSDNDANGHTSNDAALIGTNTGHDMFKSGWNSSEILTVSGTTGNHSGDMGVCVSGAYDGNVCGIEVETLNDLGSLCVDSSGGSDCFSVNGIDAWNPNNTSAVAASSGDSGGPVYSPDGSGGALARGMMDAGSSQVACTSNPPTNFPASLCFHKLFFVGMGAITGDLNVSTNITP